DGNHQGCGAGGEGPGFVMNQVVIGTAGHIDHGKTTLVKALTGTDTDRLPQEKSREMTIDLGFAFLTDDITIIDVPGHEKFIRNMVAGVSTVDIALVTIAADDGIMPQTREHIDILRLLEVPSGCIALTKTDLVEDPAWLDLLEEEIGEYVQGSFLEGAPVVRVSGETGEGVETLRRVLESLAGEARAKTDRGFFRMYVDRVFTLKGIGTVVTGTVTGGSLNKGGEVEILPGGKISKVRGLQSHERDVPSVSLGDRAAVNLSHADRSDLRRGSQLVSPGFMTSTRRLGVELSLVDGTTRSVRHQQRVRVHAGTDQVMGRVYLAGENPKRQLHGGDTDGVLIRLEKEVAAAVNDPLIIRFYSPAETIGGGTVIDTDPPAQWKTCRTWIRSLSGLDLLGRLKTYLDRYADRPLSLEAWSRRWQVAPGIIRQWLVDLPTVEFGSPENPFVTLKEAVSSQKENLVGTLEQFHQDSPYKRGISRDDLRKREGLSGPLFDHLCSQLESENRIEAVQGVVRLKEFRPRFKEKDRALARKVETILKESAFTPPTLKELEGDLDLSRSRILEIMHVLKQDGKVVEVGRDLWFPADLMASLEGEIKTFLRQNSSLAVPQFKSMTHTTRKHAIPLLEYLDRKKVTRRKGDQRVLGS
ncbi:MAG: selenocysteine-specific translation elongation factor, partial [Fidelibacterota bacterium]